MKLTNPNANQPFDYVSQDKHGNDEYGYRIVDGIEEVIHIPSGRSNMNYYMPERVTNFGDCEHIFNLIDIGKREIECRKCFYVTTFHPARNYKEENGKASITINFKDYPISMETV